jgi:hypothetical protein
MIYWSASATVVPEKEDEAKQWLKRLAQYTHDHHSVEVQVCERQDGSGGRYVWLEKHDSFAAWEEHSKRWLADSEGLAKQKEGDGLFTNFETHFWRIL